jgi:hypothetical protein
MQMEVSSEKSVPIYQIDGIIPQKTVLSNLNPNKKGFRKCSVGQSNPILKEMYHSLWAFLLAAGG